MQEAQGMNRESPLVNYKENIRDSICMKNHNRNPWDHSFGCPWSRIKAINGHKFSRIRERHLLLPAFIVCCVSYAFLFTKCQGPERMEACEIPNQRMHHLAIHWMLFTLPGLDGAAPIIVMETCWQWPCLWKDIRFEWLAMIHVVIHFLDSIWMWKERVLTWPSPQKGPSSFANHGAAVKAWSLGIGDFLKQREARQRHEKLVEAVFTQLGHLQLMDEGIRF